MRRCKQRYKTFKMSPIDFHLLAQALLYFCICIAGFLISVTVGVTKSNFQGTCILYLDWKDSHWLWSTETNCDFPFYYSVIGLLFYGLATGLYYMYAVIKSRKDAYIGSKMWVMPFILASSLHAILTLVIACMLSVGFHLFCKNAPYEAQTSRCVEFQHWVKDGKPFNPGNYFLLMTIAQSAAWTCVLLWLLQVTLSIVRFVQNQRRRINVSI